MLAALTTAALLGGRGLDAESTIQQNEDDFGSGVAVITWAHIARDAIGRPNETSTALSTPAVAFMQMAITQLAVYDVTTALQGNYEPFSYTAPPVRLFAMTFTAQADAFQAGMSAKYFYNFWGPFHAIPRADTDGNDATEADPTWAPLLSVNHPNIQPATASSVAARSSTCSARSSALTPSR